MFSPRVLAVFAFLAIAAALPADKVTPPRPVTTITDDDIDDAPWFSFPLFGNLFAPLWRLFPTFKDIGPSIIADDTKFQVVVNVKDYKTEDLKVKIKGDFMFVEGTHETKQDDRDIFASQFFHTYTLPTNASGSDVSAELSSDGYLIVTAPLNGPGEKSKEVDREVPIMETGKPYAQEVASSTTVLPLADDEDKKEPTTEREVTVKDNVIPHGSEANEIPL